MWAKAEIARKNPAFGRTRPSLREDLVQYDSRFSEEKQESMTLAEEVSMLIKVSEGTVIIREGENNMDMYKIVSGHVELYSKYGTKDESLLGIKSKDDYFGEMGLFTGGKPAVYTVVAYSDLLLMRITSADVDEFIVNNHVDVFKILQNMASTMYSLQYGMNMIMKDMEAKNYANNAHLKEFSGFYSKVFAKYNVGPDKMKDPGSKRK